jgi:hypothetical protein
MEAKTSEAEGLSRSPARLTATRATRVLDSPSASENRRFHGVDGALRPNAANAASAALYGRTESAGIVIASDGEAIQAKPRPRTPSLDRLALLATTTDGASV